jgi:hypothetical protein
LISHAEGWGGAHTHTFAKNVNVRDSRLSIFLANLGWRGLMRAAPESPFFNASSANEKKYAESEPVKRRSLAG